MTPVRTARSNFVWVGPTADVRDLHAFVELEANRTTTIWQPSPEERRAIARGSNIQLIVYGRHPPVALNVTAEQGIGEDAPEIRDRLREWQDR